MKSINYRWYLAFILFFIMSINTGCWDNRDITERAFVSAVGLDRNENNKIELTLQILRPNMIKAKQEGGSDQKAIWTFTTTGETVFEAVRNQLETVNRKPFYSHLRLIIIGEELARDGIMDVIDFFQRDHESKLTPKIIIAKGTKAKDILAAESELENIPAMHIEGILENNIAQAKTRNIELFDIFREFTSKDSNMVIGNIFLINENKPYKINDMKIEGASVLKGDKLIGFLDARETRGYLFMKDEVESGIINIDNPVESEKKVAIEIKSANGDIGVKFRDQEMILTVKVEMKGTIGEQQGIGDLSTEEMIGKLESELKAEIKNNIKSTLKVAQNKLKVDFIGFSDVVYRRHIDYWKQVKDSWNKEFTRLRIEIKVEAEVDRTGIITKPIPFE